MQDAGTSEQDLKRIDGLVALHADPKTGARNSGREEITRLRAEVDHLYRELGDLQNSLLTSNEHGDLLQEHLYRLSASLAAEIRERQDAEARLQKLLRLITQEKADLEVLVQILVDQGDVFAEEGAKARVDDLTQIPNRRRLDEYLLQQWRLHARLQKPLSLLLCDIDHFKLYNDQYGHQAGDECLRMVARTIDGRLRGGDFVARYGGEEFAVVLPHTPREHAGRVGERLLAEFATLAIPHEASPVCTSISLSIGAACIIPAIASSDARELIAQADRSLYLAKHQGRNRITLQ